MIRIVICDDQQVVREGLQAILRPVPDLEVVGLAADGGQAVAMAGRLRPDVVLMDLKMPGTNGVQATREIREQSPGVRVLVLTTYDGDEWVFDAVLAGASGYLLKDTPGEQLVQAIRGTASGHSHLDPAVAGKLLARLAASGVLPATRAVEGALDLTDRERDVLGLLAQGLSNADIARRLFLSEGTVRNYLTTVFGKLGVSDRTQAALLAVRMGFPAGPPEHHLR